MHVRELPPLRQTIQVIAPNDDRQYRWAEDEHWGCDVPSGLRYSSTMPGGFESLDCTLPRRPGVDYSDLQRLSTIRVLGASGDIAWEGRLERTPRVSGDQMAISPSAVGWQAHLDDDKSARVVYVDRDMGRWMQQTLTRTLAISTSGAAQGQIPVDVGTGKIAWTPPNQALPNLETTEVLYDIGAGQKIARVEYRGSRTGTFTSFEAPTVFTAATDAISGSSSEALTLDNTVRVATSFTDNRWAMLRARTTGAVTPPAGLQQSYDLMAVYGDHGALITSQTGDASGILASEVVKHAVGRWAPQLTTVVTTSGFVIPHIMFSDATTAGAIVLEATKYGLQDWAVWENQTFYWATRGTLGRKWRARISPTQLEETGPQVDRLWESVIVQYQDVDGSTSTVGPPGSGADTEDSVLHDDDPENPANKVGIIRRDMLVMGISTPAGAIELGRRFLEEQKLLDTSGRAQIVGHVEDDRGILHPYWRVRAGDQISFIDAADTSYRRIVKADYDYGTRTCSIDLDAPPEGLQALLERLGVVLVPLGVS